MNKIIIILLVISFQIKFIHSQSYSVTSWQSTYETISDFSSVTLEMLLNLDDDGYYGEYESWEKEFEFGFEFPFFDSTFTSVFIDSDALGYFGESEDYNLYLFDYIYAVYEPFLDDSLKLITPLVSDIRYSYDVIENNKVLKIEWKNIGFLLELDEYSMDDHHLNFQVWFYENGTIEMHFGEIKLGDSELFVEGEGLYLPGSSAPVGPWLVLVDFYDETAYTYGGDYLDPTIFPIDTIGEPFTKLPPTGWVVKFEYQEEVSNSNLLNNQLSIYPNLVAKNIHIKSSEESVSSSIYNIQGQKCLSSAIKNIDVSSLVSGIYFIQINDKNKMKTFRFIKK